MLPPLQLTSLGASWPTSSARMRATGCAPLCMLWSACAAGPTPACGAQVARYVERETSVLSTGPTVAPLSLPQSLRLVIKDSKKHPGEKLVMAFAEYTNTYFATEAMDKLQVRGAGGGEWE